MYLIKVVALPNDRFFGGWKYNSANSNMEATMGAWNDNALEIVLFADKEVAQREADKIMGAEVRGVYL